MFHQSITVSTSQLLALLTKLQQSTGCAFLDSAAAQHENSNFSVFAWQPKFVLSADLKTTNIYQNDELIHTSAQDPFELINQYLEELPNVDSALPFTGGAIGYWDYEFGGRFESLPAPKPSDIDLPNMFVGIYDQALVWQPVDSEQLTVDFISFKSDAREQFLTLQNTLSVVTGSASTFALTSDWQSNMNAQEYADKFAQVQRYLLSGDCYQINLTQKFSATYQGDEWQAYLKLREVNSAPFSSFVRLQQGAVLSVSPERFLLVENGRIETKPIKGTRPRHSEKPIDNQLADELQQATKDRAENLMIVDLLRNDLSKVAEPGSVQVPKLFAIESFPAVHHLVSTVVANIRPPFNALDLLRGAFPGGSITGAPKIRAMEIIHELEPTPRSVYCGAIGYIKTNGDMDTNITIRTLVCNQGKIHCWAGGGLVADSKCDEEYQETFDKVNKILPILSSM